MILPWRDVQIGNGPAIPTSLTADEAHALRDLARDARVLEIGSAYGFSTIIMAEVARHVTAVDPHSGYGSLPDSLQRMRENLAAYGVEEKVTIVQSCSRLALEEALADLAAFDLIFIDGDHRAEAVRRDVALAFALLADDGVLACHDFHETTCPDVATVLSEGFPAGPDRLVDTLWIYNVRDQPRATGSLG